MTPPVKHIIDNLPFVGLVLGNEHAPIIAKLIEYAVIGGVILFGTVQVLGNKIDDVGAQMNQVERVLISQDARLRAVEREAAVNSQRLNDGGGTK